MKKQKRIVLDIMKKERNTRFLSIFEERSDNTYNGTNIKELT